MHKYNYELITLDNIKLNSGYVSKIINEKKTIFYVTPAFDIEPKKYYDWIPVNLNDRRSIEISLIKKVNISNVEIEVDIIEKLNLKNKTFAYVKSNYPEIAEELKKRIPDNFFEEVNKKYIKRKDN